MNGKKDNILVLPKLLQNIILEKKCYSLLSLLPWKTIAMIFQCFFQRIVKLIQGVSQ